MIIFYIFTLTSTIISAVLLSFHRSTNFSRSMGNTRSCQYFRSADPVHTTEILLNFVSAPIIRPQFNVLWHRLRATLLGRKNVAMLLDFISKHRNVQSPVCISECLLVPVAVKIIAGWLNWKAKRFGCCVTLLATEKEREDRGAMILCTLLTFDRHTVIERF